MFDKQFGQEGHSLEHCSQLWPGLWLNLLLDVKCSKQQTPFPPSYRQFWINLWTPRRAEHWPIYSVFRYRHYCKIQIITEISCVNPKSHEYEYSGRDPLFLHQPLIYWSLVTLLNGSLNTNTFKYLSSITFTFSLTKPPSFSLLKVSGQSYIQLGMPRMGEKLDGRKKGNDH